MQYKVEICGVNTSKLKVLKNEETRALLLRTKQGDMAAREELIAGNLRLVLSVIQRFTGRGENVDDLFQVGCIGLIKAIDNFNTDLDVRFSTYGVPIAFRGRKTEGAKYMTRKDALQEAINLIQKSNIDKERKVQIIAGLHLCETELPFTKWTEEAIFDACDQFVKEHGHIRVADFTHTSLPSHPTIKNRFGMTAKKFRDTYYPLPPFIASPTFRVQDRVEWNIKFVTEFHRIRCTSGQHYNRSRSENMPVFQTMVRLNEVSSWGELLKKLGLVTYEPVRPRITASIAELPDK